MCGTSDLDAGGKDSDWGKATVWRVNGLRVCYRCFWTLPETVDRH